MATNAELVAIVVVANGHQLRVGFGVQHRDVPFSDAAASDNGEFYLNFSHQLVFSIIWASIHFSNALILNFLKPIYRIIFE